MIEPAIRQDNLLSPAGGQLAAFHGPGNRTGEQPGFIPDPGFIELGQGEGQAVEIIIPSFLVKYHGQCILPGLVELEVQGMAPVPDLYGAAGGPQTMFG